MSSQFYQRYIPPASKATNNDLSRRSAKKQITFVKSPSTGDGTSQSPSESLKSPKRLKKSHQTEDVIASIDIEGHQRHQKIHEKYRNAAISSIPDAGHESPSLQDDKQTDEEEQLHGLEPLPQPAETEVTPKLPVQSGLPEWIQKPMIASHSNTIPFDSLPFSKHTLQSLRDAGLMSSFAIQSATLPLLLPNSDDRYNGDLCIAAQTGSGKTLAYALPMIESLRKKPVRLLRGLIVLPTQLLVTQVRNVFEQFSRHTDLHVETATGSRPLKTEQDVLLERIHTQDSMSNQTHQEDFQDNLQPPEAWDANEPLASFPDLLQLMDNGISKTAPIHTSKADILICTPGRLVEHLQSTRGFSLDHVQWLVIDEADRLFDDNFQSWVNVVMPLLEYLPPLDEFQSEVHKAFHISRQRYVQKVILSASMTHDMGKLMDLRLRRPKYIQLTSDLRAETNDFVQLQQSDDIVLNIPSTLNETALPVKDTSDKPLYLLQLLDEDRQLNTPKLPIQSAPCDDSEDSETLEDDGDTSESTSLSSTTSTSEMQEVPSRSAKNSHESDQVKSTIVHPNTHGTLIFVNTNENALRLARLIALLCPDQSVNSLTKLSAASGRRAINQFCKRKVSILVASDRASRGLDLPDLAHVINYDMPNSLESYIHRVGRTARAGKQGRATTLVEHHQGRWFWNDIAKATNVRRASQKSIKKLDAVLDEAHGNKAMRETYEAALVTLGKEATVTHRHESK